MRPRSPHRRGRQGPASGRRAAATVDLASFRAQLDALRDRALAAVAAADDSRRARRRSRPPSSAARASCARCWAASARFPARTGRASAPSPTPSARPSRPRSRSAGSASSASRSRSGWPPSGSTSRCPGAPLWRGSLHPIARPSARSRASSASSASCRREPGGRDRRAELPGAQHPRGPPGARPVGHDLRGDPRRSPARSDGDRRCAALRTHTSPGPDPRDARRPSRRSAS